MSVLSCICACAEDEEKKAPVEIEEYNLYVEISEDIIKNGEFMNIDEIDILDEMNMSNEVCVRVISNNPNVNRPIINSSPYDPRSSYKKYSYSFIQMEEKWEYIRMYIRSIHLLVAIQII